MDCYSFTMRLTFLKYFKLIFGNNVDIEKAMISFGLHSSCKGRFVKWSVAYRIAATTILLVTNVKTGMLMFLPDNTCWDAYLGEFNLIFTNFLTKLYY